MISNNNIHDLCEIYTVNNILVESLTDAIRRVVFKTIGTLASVRMDTVDASSIRRTCPASAVINVLNIKLTYQKKVATKLIRIIQYQQTRIY